MLYQKLLIGSHPYFVSVCMASAFELHRHPEIELSYCREGTYDIICETKRYSLTAGDFAIVGPMTAHEFPQSNASGQRMTIELGYAFLGEYFETFAAQNANCHLYKKSKLQHTASYKRIIALLEETAALHLSKSNFCELSIKGNLYKISHLLLQVLHHSRSIDMQSKKLNDIKRIDQSLEIIYNHYYEPLSIETISAACGYSKSNFCKIFKDITGETFHHTLNRHRVEIACILLRESVDPIEKIAQETGFADAKSFCRVFKKLMGKSAGEYRKSLKGKQLQIGASS
ncbi:MAG: helix-turn-helix transcriptional regulator [Clostridia bacterium]|nr:helix-turn-helix transcriptional regulator [Clostridia bacterium]